MSLTAVPKFEVFTKMYRTQTDHVLSTRLSKPKESGTHALLDEAIRYSLFNGGKRVRPLLVYASALAITEPNALTDSAAAAVEAIHAYSLIHDDLPAMDNDDLRRGKPTCHIAFNEATAILAGDALQCLAFEWLSEPHDNRHLPAEIQLSMLQVLTQASGNKGMIAGQSLDLSAINHTLTLKQLTQMHDLKTGALINASVQMGALSTGHVNEAQLSALSNYAHAIGLAFQIQDDILDVTADTKTLGKQQGADLANNKPTFVSLLGIDQAKVQATSLYDSALDALTSFGAQADNLRHLAAYIVSREH